MNDKWYSYLFVLSIEADVRGDGANDAPLTITTMDQLLPSDRLSSLTSIPAERKVKNNERDLGWG